MRQGPLATLVVLLLALAGCLDAGGPDAKGTTGAAAPDPGLEGDGRITGVITDDELQPLEGVLAWIAFLNGTVVPGRNATTNENGVFEILRVPIGDFLLQARKAEFRDAKPHAVRITNDESLDVKLQLESLARIEPHHLSVQARFFFTYQACAFAAGAMVRCSTGYQVANASKSLEFHEVNSGLVQALVGEMAWQATVDVCAQTMRFDLFSPQYKGSREPDQIDAAPKSPFHWTNVPDKTRNPIKVVMPREGSDPRALLSPERTALNGGTPIALSGKWSIEPWSHRAGALGTPVDYYCLIQQPVHYYLSAFFVDPPPDGYSATKA